jgi:hypothetical protein
MPGEIDLTSMHIQRESWIGHTDIFERTCLQDGRLSVFSACELLHYWGEYQGRSMEAVQRELEELEDRKQLNSFTIADTALALLISPHQSYWHRDD